MKIAKPIIILFLITSSIALARDDFFSNSQINKNNFKDIHKIFQSNELFPSHLDLDSTPSYYKNHPDKLQQIGQKIKYKKNL